MCGRCRYSPPGAMSALLAGVGLTPYSQETGLELGHLPIRHRQELDVVLGEPIPGLGPGLWLQNVNPPAPHSQSPLLGLSR